MHFVIYIPTNFYASVAAAIVEILQTSNDVMDTNFTFEFVSHATTATSKSGIHFDTRIKPTRKIDVLLVLAGVESEPTRTMDLLDAETRLVRPLLEQAIRDNALIAASCGAAYILAGNGILDGKPATLSWWLRQKAERAFPKVRWDVTKMVINSGNIYTGAASFAGLELISRILIDSGYKEAEQRVRSLLALPPMREFQTPYITEEHVHADFETRLRTFALAGLPNSTIDSLARKMGMSPRTLARKSLQELHTSPNKWLQELRLEVAKKLLRENRSLTIQQVCQRVGYHDMASFSRLFSQRTGMAPGKYRSQLLTV